MEKREISEILKFLLSGLIQIFVVIIIVQIFKKNLNIWYLWAIITADIINLSIGFIMKKFWVFKGKQLKKTPKQIIISIIISILFFVTNIGLMHMFVEKFNINIFISQAIIAIILSIISYIINKNIIFKR